MADIKAALTREGYFAHSIEGPALSKQLVEIIKATRQRGAF